jgi:methylated-DNA-protein-cysteine methyltransferase related protein
MPKSPAYARIKRDVYAVARAIPAGRVATYADVARFLDVIPRQVAYLLALRNDDERETCPWHRVVGDDGSLGRPKVDAYGRSQRALLEAEGIAFDDKGRVDALPSRRLAITRALSGVRPTQRPTATR